MSPPRHILSLSQACDQLRRVGGISPWRRASRGLTVTLTHVSQTCCTLQAPGSFKTAQSHQWQSSQILQRSSQVIFKAPLVTPCPAKPGHHAAWGQRGRESCCPLLGAWSESVWSSSYLTVKWVVGLNSFQRTCFKFCDFKINETKSFEGLWKDPSLMLTVLYAFLQVLLFCGPGYTFRFAFPPLFWASC